MIMMGSMWVAKDAPGAAEYIAYQKAAAKSDMAAAAVDRGRHHHARLEKMMKAMSSVDGLPT